RSPARPVLPAGGGDAPAKGAGPFAPTKGGHIPDCRFGGGDRAGRARSARLHVRADDVYRRVVGPRGPRTPAPITRGSRSGAFQGANATSRLPRRPFPGSGPYLPAFRAT